MSALAVFGGSFDPPHVGHVLAASWVLCTAAVDRLLVVPAFAHAFGKELAPFEHRRAMCELAFDPLRGVTVSDVEARAGGPSYTVHTLERLRAAHPGATLRLVIGSDLVEQVPTWHEGHRVPELAPLLVVGRGGHVRGTEDVSMPEVSSSEVRRRLAGDEPADALVPRAVLAYAREKGLYRA